MVPTMSERLETVATQLTELKHEDGLPVFANVFRYPANFAVDEAAKPCATIEAVDTGTFKVVAMVAIDNPEQAERQILAICDALRAFAPGRFDWLRRNGTMYRVYSFFM